jgi:hypothetical protein
MEGPQASHDIAETVAESQLGKDHAEELVVTRKRSAAMVAPVATDTGVELMARNELHQLRKEHAVVIQEAVLSNRFGRFLYRRSNRKQPFSFATFCSLRSYRKFNLTQPDSIEVR